MPVGGCGNVFVDAARVLLRNGDTATAIAALEREVMLQAHHSFCVARDGIETDRRRSGRGERHDRHRLLLASIEFHLDGFQGSWRRFPAFRC